MAFTDRIQVVIDFVTDGAKRGLGQLKADVAAADGVMGKTKATASGLGQMIGPYMGTAALAGGAAVVGFAKKSVAAFQDTALAAGKFADTTAVSVEEASRWIAVGDDFGISADTISGALARVNKASDGVFAQYGIEVVKAADGTRDANATFINALDAIGKMPDTNERARASTALFGKSYAEISRLIEMGAKDVQAALAGVSDAQVINDGELLKAREYQAAMDRLGDEFRDLMLVVGESLVPSLSAAADAFSTFSDATDKIGGTDGSLAKIDTVATRLFGDTMSLGVERLGELKEMLDDTSPSADEIAESMDEAADRAEYYASRVESAGEESSAAAKSIDIAAESAQGIRDAAAEAADEVDRLYNELREDINIDQALADVEQGFMDLETAGAEAYKAAADGAWEAGEKAAEYEQKQRDLKLEVIDYAEQLGDIPPEVVSDILALIDAGSVAEAKAAIDSLDVDRDVTITVHVNQEGGVDLDGDGIPDARSAMAGGRRLSAMEAWYESVLGQDNADTGGGSSGGVGGGAPRDPDALEGTSNSQAARIKRQVDKASRMYERGDITAGQYLDILRTAVPMFKKYSDFGMWLWREIKRVRADVKEASRPDDGENDPWHHKPGGGRPGPGPADGGAESGAGAGRNPKMGSRSAAGVTVVVNQHGVLVSDGKAMRRALDAAAADIAAALRRWERGQG